MQGGQIVNACMQQSTLWHSMKVLHLTQNMQLNVDDAQDEKMQHAGYGGSFNWGPVATQSAPTVAAIMEESSEVSSDEGSANKN